MAPSHELMWTLIETLHLRSKYLRFSLEDAGRYYLENASNNFCKLLIVNINTQDQEPECRSVYLEEYKNIELACEWMSDVNDERVTFETVGDIMWESDLADPNIPMSSSNNLHKEFATNFTVDILAKHLAPIRCVISQPGHCNRSCEFPVSMKRSVNEITWEETRIASFTCSCSNEDLASIWWYSQPDKLIRLNKTIQYFSLNQSHSRNIEETCKRNDVYLWGGKWQTHHLEWHGSAIDASSSKTLHFCDVS